LSFAFEQAKASVIELATSVGEALAPTIKQLADSIKQIAGAIIDWAQKNQSVVVTIGKISAALVVLGGSTLVVGKLVTALSALPAVAKAAMIAVAGIGKALTFLMAHPAILGIAALVAVFVALSSAIRNAKRYVAEYNEEQQKTLEVNEQQRSSDRQKMARLKQLTSNERLNNAEMQEARTLIQQLESQYGNLGVVLDRTTGKLSILADGFKTASKRMREAAEADIEAAISEVRNNIEELQRDMVAPQPTSILGALLGTGQEQENERLAALLRKTEVEQAKLRALMEKRGALGEPGTSELAARSNAVRRQNEQEAQATEEWLRKIKQLELQKIEDVHKRNMQLIDERYREEIKKAQEAGMGLQHIQTIVKAHALEIDAERKRHADKLAEEEKRKREQNEADLARLADQNADQAYRNKQLELETQYEGLELQRELLKLEEERRIEAARAAGLNIEAVEREFDLRQRIMEQAAAAADALNDTIERITVRGTFSALAIGGLGLEGPMQDQVKLLRQIERNTREGGGLAFT